MNTCMTIKGTLATKSPCIIIDSPRINNCNIKVYKMTVVERITLGRAYSMCIMTCRTWGLLSHYMSEMSAKSVK